MQKSENLMAGHILSTK